MLPPFVTQVFWPFMMYVPSAWRFVYVLMALLSEPAPGSEYPWHHQMSPDSVGGRNFAFCSGVPKV